MKHLLTILFLFVSLSVMAQQGSLSQSVYKSRVNDTTATSFTDAISSAIAAGYGYIFWNNQATTPHWDIYTDAGVEHVFTFEGSGGGGGAGSSSALTDGAAITITGSKHTLTSDEATVTWTLSQTSDFQTTDITLNATTTTWTFPANTLCVYEGVASGDNTATLSGTSGDHYILSIYKDGTNYRVVIKNFGQ